MGNRFNDFLSLNRKLALKAVPFLARTPFTPNQLTSLSLLLGIVAAYFFSLGSRISLLEGAFFLQLSFIADNCDGGVARLKNLSSEFGMWYDFVADLFVDFA